METKNWVFISAIGILLIFSVIISYYPAQITGFTIGDGEDSHSYILNGSEVKIKALQLDYVCTNEIEDVWRVSNRNEFELEYSWEETREDVVLLSGQGSAIPDRVYLQTPKTNGTTNLKISVLGMEHDSKDSGSEDCGEEWDSSEEVMNGSEELNESDSIINETIIVNETGDLGETIIVNESDANETINAENLEITTTQEITTQEITTQTELIETTTAIPTTNAPAASGGGESEDTPKKVVSTTTQKIIPTTKASIISTTQKIIPTTQTPTTIPLIITVEEEKSFIARMRSYVSTPFALIGSVVKIPIDKIKNNLAISLSILLIAGVLFFYVARSFRRSPIEDSQKELLDDEIRKLDIQEADEADEDEEN